MEPENTPPDIEEENHLNQTIMFRFQKLIFGVVFSLKHHFITSFWCVFQQDSFLVGIFLTILQGLKTLLSSRFFDAKN